MSRYSYKSHQSSLHTYLDSYSFGPEHAFTMCLADNAERKRQAVELVQRMHSERGYNSAGSNQPDAFDFVEGARTFLVKSRGQAVGTLRIIPDSSKRLPIDRIYPDILSSLRSQNRSICEIASMAVDTSNSREAIPVLMELFRLAWLTARHMMGGSDMLASVMAHHISFYQKLLLFDEVSHAPRVSPRTGCPVSFCRLDLRLAENRYREHFARRRGSRNLHHFFCEDKIISERKSWLFQNSVKRTETFSSKFNISSKWKTCSTTMKPLLAMSA